MIKPAFVRRSVVLRALPAVLLAFVACGKAKIKSEPLPQEQPHDPANQPAGLSLSVPEDHWDASRFCGPVTPQTPENPFPAYIFPPELINEKLAGEGLRGWIHGAVPSYQQYVFTYQNEDPDDDMAFFHAKQFSLVPATDAVAATLAGLKRHDEVRLKGAIFPNGSPLTHLKVTAVEIVKKYPLSTDNPYSFDLAQLNGVETFPVFGQVHATIDSEKFGRAIVVERDNLLLPLAVPASLNDIAAKLFRGDIVNVIAKLVHHEKGPPHFEIDGNATNALQVVDPLLNCHGLAKTVTGYLAKFDKSPAINRDIYAVRVVDANGVGRNFTLFPADAEDFELFKALMVKAKTAWDSSAEEPQVVRNFWKKESLKISVTGTLNVVSPDQANAQIYVKSADDITISP